MKTTAVCAVVALTLSSVAPGAQYEPPTFLQYYEPVGIDVEPSALPEVTSTNCECPHEAHRNRKGRPEDSTHAGGSSSCSTAQLAHWIFTWIP